MLRMVRNHRRAAHGEKTGYERLAAPPVRLDHAARSAAEAIERWRRRCESDGQ
jgi:ribonucleoside-diphosphate reductase alpha chain